VTSLELCERGEDRDRARRAGCLVTRGRDPPQRRARCRCHRAKVRLAREQLAERVADVNDANISWLDLRMYERDIDKLTDEIDELETIARETSGEVALGSAENECRHPL
jgi:hypothetical protein